jgi:hypothetical protein
MIRLLADENIRRAIVGELMRRSPAVDIVRAQEVGLADVHDEIVLAWAAREGRIVLTHDINTMRGYGFRRLAAGERMPGMFLIPWTAPLGPVIEDLLLIAEASQPDEWEGRIEYLPF